MSLLVRPGRTPASFEVKFYLIWMICKMKQVTVWTRWWWMANPMSLTAGVLTVHHRLIPALWMKHLPISSKLKPNADIIEDFDSIIPFRMRERGGHTFQGRTIPPPHWEDNQLLHSASANGAVYRDDEGELQVTIRSWIAAERGTMFQTFRDVTIRAQLMGDIEVRIRRTWADQIQATDQITLTTVRPTPRIGNAGQARPLHMLIEINRPAGSVKVPILIAHREIDADGPSARIIWIPILVTSPIGLTTLHGICSPPCSVDQMLVPQPGRVRRWLATGQQRIVTAGLFLPIWWDLRLRPPAPTAADYDNDHSSLFQVQVDGQSHVDRPPPHDGDVQSLMQQPPNGDDEAVDESQDIEYLIAHTFHMSTSYKMVQLELNPRKTLIEQLTPVWQLRHPEAIVALHEVHDPPHELQTSAENTILVEMSQDSLRKSQDTDCMILADIQLNDPRDRLHGIKIRKVLWARARMTHAQVLNMFNADAICIEDEIRCSIWKNKVYWPNTDTAIRQLANGDFIHILIRSVQTLNVQDMYRSLCSQEAADSQRYLYRQSPTSEDRSLQDSQRPTERDGTRSRSRSLSLLQVSSHKITVTGSHVHSQDDGSESKPHVNDRWCAQSLDRQNESDEDPEIKSSPTRVVIDLQSSITPPCWVRVNYQQVQDLRNRLMMFHIGPVDPTTAKVVKWHDATIDAFATTPPWTNEPVLHYQFFTDGSSYRQATDAGEWIRNGAAAVVLIVSTPEGDRFGGSLTFSLDDSPTAPQTEIAAVTLALLWIKDLAQYHNHYSHPFQATIGFDCMTAGKASEGHWKIIANQESQTTNRALTQWIQQQYGPWAVQWRHISSHQGHAWNEAADALAWAAVHQWINAAEFQPVRDLLDDPTSDFHVASWLWFLEASLQGSSQVPRNDGSNFLVDIAAPLAHTADPALQPIALRCQQDAHEGARMAFDFCLRCATANVLTLYSKEDSKGTFISARQESILRQMQQQNVHVAGIQETRSAADGHASAEGFHILSSPASTRGVGGVQLWVAMKWHFEQFSIDIAVHHLRVVHSTTQRMIVALDNPGMKMLFVVAHAPACESPETTRKFWMATSAAVPKKFHDWPTIHLLDANARIGSTTSLSVGSYGEETENDAGAEFHEWLLQHRYVVPQSFSQHHEGPHETWHHPRGPGARLDFIAIDPCLMHEDVRTWVSEEVDLTLQRIDHLCVMADIPMSYLRCNSTHAAPHNGTKDEKSPDLSDIPWQVNVHDHAAMLQHYMQQHQKTDVQQRRRKHHLREETWHLVGWKKFHWKRMRQVRRAATNNMLRAIFSAWSTKKKVLQGTGWLRLCDFTFAWHLHQYGQCACLSQKQIRQDDKDYYQSLMAEATQANADEGLAGLWRNIKGVLPKTRKKAASNIRCRGPATSDIRDHFNSLEAGESIKYEALLHQCQMRQHQAKDEAPLVIPLSQFPTRIDFEQQVLRQHPRRAPGLDRVQGMTLRRALHDHPIPFYTLLFKTWATGAEPLQFKGGLIHCISKKTSGRAGDAKAKDMRGIMLLDGLGKSCRALIRSHLMRWSSPRRLPTQFGGYKGQQTLFATQFIRSIAHVAQEAKVSTSMLFLDVRSAFHSMLREQTFGGRLHFAPRLRQLLGDEGFEVDGIEADINRYSRDFTESAPVSIQRLLQDAHESTWFTIAHHDECYQTHRGSRPGSPLADLAYNTMMQSVLHEVTQVLKDSSDIVAASAQIGLRVGPIAWVDDVAIPIMTSTAQQLDDATANTLIKVDKIFRAHGLRLNYSDGKWWKDGSSATVSWNWCTSSSQGAFCRPAGATVNSATWDASNSVGVSIPWHFLLASGISGAWNSGQIEQSNTGISNVEATDLQQSQTPHSNQVAIARLSGHVHPTTWCREELAAARHQNPQQAQPRHDEMVSRHHWSRLLEGRQHNGRRALSNLGNLAISIKALQTSPPLCLPMVQTRTPSTTWYCHCGGRHGPFMVCRGEARYWVVTNDVWAWKCDSCEHRSHAAMDSRQG